jgi:hypothetical protein
VQEARDLVARRDFKALEVGIGRLLEQGHEIGPELCERVQEITRQDTKTLPATARAGKDAGQFDAIGDLHPTPGRGDRFPDGAFARTIKRWQGSGEQIPLFWLESPSFAYPVGSVDPATLRIQEGFGPLSAAALTLTANTAQRHATHGRQSRPTAWTCGWNTRCSPAVKTTADAR